MIWNDFFSRCFGESMEIVLGALGASGVVFWSNFRMLMCGVGSRELSDVSGGDFWWIFTPSKNLLEFCLEKLAKKYKNHRFWTPKTLPKWNQVGSKIDQNSSIDLRAVL